MARAEEVMSATELNAYAQARIELLTEMYANVEDRKRGLEAEAERLKRLIAHTRSQQMAAAERLITVHASSELLKRLEATTGDPTKPVKP